MAKKNSVFPLIWLAYSICAYFLALAFLIVLIDLFKNPLWINHDSAMYLQEGQLVLNGKQPYVDFFEVNPPFIIYLNVLPAFIAKAFNIHPIIVFNVLIFLFSIWSVLVIKNLLSSHVLIISPLSVRILQVFFAYYLLYLFFISEFAQREYLLLLALFPYFILRFARNEHAQISLFLAILIGFFIAIFISLKPQYILVILAIEIYWLFKNKKHSFAVPEFYTFIATILFICVFIIFHFEVLKVYLFRWIPLFYKKYYLYNSTDSNDYLYLMKCIIISLIAIVIQPFCRNQLSKMLQPSGIALIVSSILFFIDKKYWFYHKIPSLFFLYLIFLLFLNEGFTWIRRIFLTLGWKNTVFLDLRKLKLNILLHSITIGFMILLCIYSFRRMHYHRKDSSDEIKDVIINYTMKNEKILFIDTSIGPAYPIMTIIQREPGSRYLVSMPIALLQKKSVHLYHSLKDASQEEKQFLKELILDIKVNKPVLIIINSGECQACPKGFTIYEYLKEMGVLRQILNGYTLLETIDDQKIFILRDENKTERLEKN